MGHWLYALLAHYKIQDIYDPLQLWECIPATSLRKVITPTKMEGIKTWSNNGRGKGLEVAQAVMNFLYMVPVLVNRALVMEFPPTYLFPAVFLNKNLLKVFIHHSTLIFRISRKKAGC